MIKNPIETAPKDGTWVLLWGGQTNEEQYPTPLLAEEDKHRPIVGRWMGRNTDCGEPGFWEFGFNDGWWGHEYKNPQFWTSLAA